MKIRATLCFKARSVAEAIDKLSELVERVKVEEFTVYVSPFSLGSVEAEIKVQASSLDELKALAEELKANRVEARGLG